MASTCQIWPVKTSWGQTRAHAKPPLSPGEFDRLLYIKTNQLRNPGSVRHPLQAENETLRKENTRLSTRLKQAELIIDVQKKSHRSWASRWRRPRKAGAPDGHHTIALSTEIGIKPACDALGIVRSGFYRGQGPATAPAPRPSPPRTLSSEERQAVLATLHSDRFVDTAPATVYATLLDEGRYHCSIRTLYRILDEQAEVTERRNQLRHPVYQKPELLATAPNQVWSWNITKLLGPVKWSYCNLYVTLDIFSRYVVGWMVAPAESAVLAQRLIKDTCEKQQIRTGQLPLHADRGSSMKSKPVALLLADLGITKTHSRPYTSDNNPFSQAQFKTLKYHPDFSDASAASRTPASSVRRSSPGTTASIATRESG